MFRRRPQPLSSTDNLKLYLSEAVLPPMAHGSCAPPMPPEGHKAHLNHIVIQPEAYRARFAKIVTPKSLGVFDKAVLEFVDSLPCERLEEPKVDEKTGLSFTVPAPGFNIQLPSLPRPTNIYEVAPWVTTLPLQTMTRALHVAFPETKSWDVTYADSDNPDPTLWKTLVWRKTPPPSNIETFWTQPADPLEKCSVVFAIQPPWIMTPKDLKSFVKCTSIPPYNDWDPAANLPFTSAERVWAKLWDTCVRRACHHWVLSTYWGWVFGAFTQGFTAGQILDMKDHDAKEPTVMQCLVYHVASSMDLVAGSRLPQYPEQLDHSEWILDIPPPSHEMDTDFPDSGSEWDGMDNEPGISAGVSQTGGFALSAWGSVQEFCTRPQTIRYPQATVSRRHTRHSILPPDQVERVENWYEGVVDEPPPYEYGDPPSPAATEVAFSGTGLETASIYNAARRAGSEIPEVTVEKQESTAAFGGYLMTLIKQGPDE